MSNSPNGENVGTKIIPNRMTKEQLNQLDLQALILSKSGIPHGYELPNGIVVIWQNGQMQNNNANIKQAKEMFPNLALVSYVEILASKTTI